ncbi:MAG: hypothetical protein SX243_18495 [Acidobacteriota bacterium]|nr:hypothetical protein [Acidobacteriota bacterium]
MSAQAEGQSSPAQGSDREAGNAVTEVDILIVGFGFSCIPLLRELDLRGTEYTIVSDRNPVWKLLEESGRLDFDLVSSYHGSFYSFDLAADPEGYRDRYTTAEEFYGMHLRYLEHYRDQIHFDHVDLIENYDTYSLVHTSAGKVYRAKQVIVSTGFRRKIHSTLSTFDYSIKGKTVLFTTMGDSANLMISKLIPRGNKILVATDRFMALDKILTLSGRTFTNDQLESHNLSYVAPRVYRRIVWGSFTTALTRLAILLMGTPLHRPALRLIGWIGKLFTSQQFIAKYPETFSFRSPRQLAPWSARRKLVPWPNGVIAIKHWPIDAYAEHFDGRIEEAIEEGYILNDIHYFIDQGYVTLYPKSRSSIDREGQTLTHDGETVAYDFLVEGDRETPRIPKIVIKHSGGDGEYRYRFKGAYLGIVPEELRNIFLIGFARPTTAGLATLTEMQCLFVHQMLAEPEFKASVYENVSERIEKYNARHYHYQEDGPADHVVFFGTYVEDVARAMGINQSLQDCKTRDERTKFLFFPNAPFKYRVSGKYEVEGCDRLVDQIYRNHDRFWIHRAGFWRVLLYRVMIVLAWLRFYLDGSISLGGFVALLLLTPLFFRGLQVLTGLLSSSKKVDVAQIVYAALGVVAVGIFGGHALWFVLGGDMLATLVLRQLKPSWVRYAFGDLKVKSKFKGFFQRYLEAYRRVHRIGQEKEAA